MPLTASVTAPIFIAMMASSALVGVSTPQLALACATGLELYGSSGLIVASVDVGVLGAGVGTGIGMIVPPTILTETMIGAFTAQALLGPMSISLATAIALATSTALATAIIQTVNPTVGIGTGVAKAIPNPISSAAAFIAGFIAAGLVGPMSINLATAISVGLDEGILAGVGAIVIAGSPSIIPSSGVGIGVLS